jgi:mRNA-degrading endonuclease toxin of MazEF toxin-antitoxin module
VNLDPSAGREQAGPHFVIVVSDHDYNAITGLPFAAPVTTIGNASRYAGFAVNLTGSGLRTTGVIQLDQIKPMDLAARGGRATGERLPDYLLDEVLYRFGTIFGFERE